MNIEWLPVVGFEGLYEVSSTGSIRSIARRQGTRVGRILAGRLSTSLNDTWRTRYFRVALRKDGQRFEKPIHHLVAEAFLGPRPLGLEINHRDGNPQNNAASNLEYVTHSENVRQGWVTTRRPRVA